jgi:hypothetical protein
MSTEYGAPSGSLLFTVRLWREERGDGQTEWRGKVQYITTGEAYYFRAWPDLIAHLLAMSDNALQSQVPDPTIP